MLTSGGGGIDSIPVASLLRAGDRRIHFAVRADSDVAARIRESPEIALSVLGEHGTAFTAQGHARILA